MSKGADCGLTGCCPALFSASCETGAEPFQSHPRTTVYVPQKIYSDRSKVTDLSWLHMQCLVSKKLYNSPLYNIHISFFHLQS